MNFPKTIRERFPAAFGPAFERKGECLRLKIESLPVDGKRSVILVRRDNIEHLVMVGGRNDLVIEPNIMGRPAPNPARRPALEWKGLPPAPTREPPAEPPAKNLHHNLEKLTRRLEAELRGSPRKVDFVALGQIVVEALGTGRQSGRPKPAATAKRVD